MSNPESLDDDWQKIVGGLGDTFDVFATHDGSLGGEQAVQAYVRRFDPDFKGWEPGALVRGKFLLMHVYTRNGVAIGLTPTEEQMRLFLPPDMHIPPEPDPEGPTMRFIQPDVFVLDATRPDVVDALESSGCQAIDVTMQIKTIDPEAEYEVEVVTFHGVEAPCQAPVATLELNDVAVLQGEVIAVGPMTESYTKQVTLRLTTGEVVHVTMDEGMGAIKGVSDANPQATGDPMTGDIIQVRARAKIGELFGIRANLMVSGSVRQNKYDNDRVFVRSSLRALQGTTDPKRFRSYLSTLVHTLRPQDSNGHLCLTQDEVAQLQAVLARSLHTFDGEEWPLAAFLETPDTDITDVGGAIDLEQRLGIDLFAMSRLEFFNYMTRMARLKQPDKGCGGSLFAILRNSCPSKYAEQVARTTIEIFCSPSFDLAQIPSEQGETKYYSMVMGAIDTLARADTRRNMQSLIELIDYASHPSRVVTEAYLAVSDHAITEGLKEILSSCLPTSSKLQTLIDAAPQLEERCRALFAEVARMAQGSPDETFIVKAQLEYIAESLKEQLQVLYALGKERKRGGYTK